MRFSAKIVLRKKQGSGPKKIKNKNYFHIFLIYFSYDEVYYLYYMNMANQLHESNRTTITLSKENYERLKKLGTFGESFDDVLGRVLGKVKEAKN
jgi:hypothetical protein